MTTTNRTRGVWARDKWGRVYNGKPKHDREVNLTAATRTDFSDLDHALASVKAIEQHCGGDPGKVGDMVLLLKKGLESGRIRVAPYETEIQALLDSIGGER